MSRAVSLSCAKDGILELSVDNCSIQLDELRIRGASNLKYPHEVLGKGGARMRLTDNECCRFIAEYMRYRFFQLYGAPDDEKPEYQQKDCSFEFRVGLTDYAIRARLEHLEQLSHRP